MAAKKLFRFDRSSDTALLTEIMDLGPYSSAKPKVTWELISDNLTSINPAWKVTGRSCRERAGLLIDKNKPDTSASLKSSGPAEDYTPFDSLLESVKNLYTDSQLISKLKTNQSDRKKALKVREEATQALELQDGREEPSTPVMDTDSGEGQQRSPSTSKPGMPTKRPHESPNEGLTKKRASQNSMLNYLEQKNKNEVDLRREELRLRELEIMNKKDELRMQAEKQAGETAERQAMLGVLAAIANKLG